MEGGGGGDTYTFSEPALSNPPLVPAHISVSFGRYDFIYLRIDFAKNTNAGYASVTFLTPEYLMRFVGRYDGKEYINGVGRGFYQASAFGAAVANGGANGSAAGISEGNGGDEIVPGGLDGYFGRIITFRVVGQLGTDFAQTMALCSLERDFLCWMELELRWQIYLQTRN